LYGLFKHTMPNKMFYIHHNGMGKEWEESFRKNCTIRNILEKVYGICQAFDLTNLKSRDKISNIIQNVR